MTPAKKDRITWGVSLHKLARLGGFGGMLPQEILKNYVDALRLLLRPFWDRSRAVVATWLAEYCPYVSMCFQKHGMTSVAASLLASL